MTTGTHKIELSVRTHPGRMLKEKIEEMEIPVEEFARRVFLPTQTVLAIISAECSITADMALAFEQTTGIPSSLWIKRQHAYDEYILAQKNSSWIERLQSITRKTAAVL